MQSHGPEDADEEVLIGRVDVFLKPHQESVWPYALCSVNLSAHDTEQDMSVP